MPRVGKIQIEGRWKEFMFEEKYCKIVAKMTGSLFVTGGSGYIGRHLLRSLDSHRYSKIVYLSRAAPASAPSGEVIRADLLEGSAYAEALKGCDTVLHMAAVTGKSRPAEYFRVNREGTRMLIGECCRAGVRRFIYVSTIAVKFRDQHRYYYAQSKCQAEELVRSSGLQYTIVRPTMVMGKGAAVMEGLSRLACAPPRSIRPWRRRCSSRP